LIRTLNSELITRTLLCRLGIAAAVCHCSVSHALAATAASYDAARTAFDSGDYGKAVDLFAAEVRDNPGHEDAYRFWAESLEKTGDLRGALAAWETLKTISPSEETQTVARREMLRLERVMAAGKNEEPKFTDPFDMGDLEVDYTGLEEVESSDYHEGYPPFVHETRNFTVFACNEKLAKQAAEVCEKALAFLQQRLLAGRAWAIRVPILIYANHDDYVKVGGNPASSGGVTYQDHSGRTARIAIPQLYDEETVKRLKAKNSVSYNLEDVLPHELTHMVLNEFFGAQEIPRWLHEAFARQMEQNRQDREAAANLAVDAVAGEYYRFRDFFATKQYPSTHSKVMRFYEQAATTVLFLLEQGPEATRAFLTELAHQRGHDAAVAAAFGIPEEGAVEEFERRWVEWMGKRYVQDLKRDDRPNTVDAVASTSALFNGPFDELASISTISKWEELKANAAGQCLVLGGSPSEWEFDASAIRATPSDDQGQNLLGLRLYEELPIAIKCRVRLTADTPSGRGWFGVSVLDEQKEDTGNHTLVTLRDRRAHDVVCVVSNDLAVFVDDKCVGRCPLPAFSDDVEIDYPVGLFALSPVEITELKAATIDAYKVSNELAQASDEGADAGGSGGSEPGAGGGDGGGTKPPPDKPKKPDKPKEPEKPKKEPPKKRPPGVRGPD